MKQNNVYINTNDGQINIANDNSKINAVQNNNIVERNINMKKGVRLSMESKIEIFLSYCWEDENIANDVYMYLKKFSNVNIHKDKIDIGTWSSIKEYMQSISNMDYTILLISDFYLKSSNCMYEVLEVIKDRNYKNKIFPVVITIEIYKPISRAKYVKYWQSEQKKLEEELTEISIQNIGQLDKDLKRLQDIASNISEFLGLVSDMNNPNISDVNLAIKNKLEEKFSLNCEEDIVINKEQNDMFSMLNISKSKINSKPTDLEQNQFVERSFNQIKQLLQQLGEQLKIDTNIFQVLTKNIDSQTVIYQLYSNGNYKTGIKLFLGNIFGEKVMSIYISNDSYSFGNNNSCNGMYCVKIVDNKLKLYGAMSLYKQNTMTVEEVVKDIWTSYIESYLK